MYNGNEASEAVITNPPPLPGTGSRAQGNTAMFAGMATDFKAMDGEITLNSVADNVLKHPGRIICELQKGRRIQVATRLALMITLAMAVYGFVIGCFSGGIQMAVAPAKLVLGTFFCALITLPSLYIMASLSGSRLTLAEVFCVLMLMLALVALLLVGFAPVAWVFSQSTGAVAFMGVLHWTFWLAGIFIGLSLLGKAFRLLSNISGGLIATWAVIFIAVVFQMTTSLRPIISKADGLNLQEKKFFLTHWIECCR